MKKEKENFIKQMINVNSEVSSYRVAMIWILLIVMLMSIADIILFFFATKWGIDLSIIDKINWIIISLTTVALTGKVISKFEENKKDENK